MIQNSIIHYTNFSFLRLIYYISLLPKLDFAHFEFDLLYTVHFKMHFFIEQYLSIILKLLKIVARMILQQYYKFMIAYRNFGQIRLPKPFRVNPQCVCVIIYVQEVVSNCFSLCINIIQMIKCEILFNFVGSFSKYQQK